MAPIRDPRLDDNLMYQKMVGRVEAFYIQAERLRRQGAPTPPPSKGFSFAYREELTRCLKQLMIGVLQQKNPKVLKLYVAEVYRWLMNKLMQMGALSKSEQIADAALLNPMANSMGARMNQILKQKLLFNLVDPQETRKHAMAMFDESDVMPPQRTQIKEIPPASIRIQSVKTRSLKGFDSRVEEIRENEAKLIARKQAKLEENHSY